MTITYEPTKRVANRFEKGSGVYNCRSCGRGTRSTGRGDNENVRLCEHCYEAAGIENQICDEGSTPELEAELNGYIKEIEKRGGTYRRNK